MATSLLSSPLSSSSIDNRIGVLRSSFIQNTNQIYNPSRRTNSVRRWSYRSPVASNQFNHIPKRFREENLADGLMDNYKNVPPSLYGLNPGQIDMFMGETNIISRQTDATKEESLSSSYNYINYGGMYTMSGNDNDKITAKYSATASMYGGRGRSGRPRRSPPDLPSMLLDSRIIYIGMPLVQQVTELIAAQFMWLDYDSDKPIYLYINCTGTLDEKNQIVGADTEAYSVIDMINQVQPQVCTMNLGVAYGHAAMILAYGAPGCRGVMASSFTKFYMPSISNSNGPSIDMWLQAKELDTSAETYIDLVSEGVGKPRDVVAKDIVRGLYLNAHETVAYGAADKIMYTLDGEYDKKDFAAMAAQRNALKEKMDIKTATPRVGQTRR